MPPSPSSRRRLCVQERPLAPPRLVAAVLLCTLAAHDGLRLRPYFHAPATLFANMLWMLAALALGACLWWVAKRQVGRNGAAVALGLFVFSPLVVHAGTAAFASLGLFAMLYTAVGVAHALQGPRRKWAPRILLMASLTAFTACVHPLACGVGLLLALIVFLYLAEGKRRLAPPLLLVWSMAGAAGLLVLHFGFDRLRYTSFGNALTTAIPQPVTIRAEAGLLLSLAAAGLLWLVAPRSRFFGNTAPALAAVLLAGVSLLLGGGLLLWALPFALLFAAGVFADGMEGRHSWLWKALGVAVVAIQLSRVIQGF